MTSPLFIWLTLVFHGLIASAAACLRYLEADVNPALKPPINALYWAFSTVTTVGYGDIVPMTPLGKSVAIILMMTGAIFTAIYTALFASTLLATEFDNVERDVQTVKTNVRALQREVRNDESQIEFLVAQLNDAIAALRDKDVR